MTLFVIIQCVIAILALRSRSGNVLIVDHQVKNIYTYIYKDCLKGFKRNIR